MMISSSGLTSSNSPLRFFVSLVVNAFLVLTIFVLTVGNFGIAGNFGRIGVKA